MDDLYQILPKDLVYIVEDYAKDRTEYNRVLDQFNNFIPFALFAANRFNNELNPAFRRKYYTIETMYEDCDFFSLFRFELMDAINYFNKRRRFTNTFSSVVYKSQSTMQCYEIQF